MKLEERLKKQKELVEVIGRVHSKQGILPASGRIVALLTVMDKEQYTFDEIVEELQISTSSASIALRYLEEREIIEYITLSGERKRYFSLRKRDKLTLVDEMHETLRAKACYMQKIYDLKANKSAENAIFLKDLIDMIEFFLKKYDDLKKEYFKGKE